MIHTHRPTQAIDRPQQHIQTTQRGQSIGPEKRRTGVVRPEAQLLQVRGGDAPILDLRLRRLGPPPQLQGFSHCCRCRPLPLPRPVVVFGCVEAVSLTLVRAWRPLHLWIVEGTTTTRPTQLQPIAQTVQTLATATMELWRMRAWLLRVRGPPVPFFWT